jgi:hypothetical protein
MISPNPFIYFHFMIFIELLRKFFWTNKKHIENFKFNKHKFLKHRISKIINPTFFEIYRKIYKFQIINKYYK